MDAEIAEYAASIRSRFALLEECIGDFPEARLNDRPIPGGNSAWALVEHTIGNARAWILGIALGEERGRDRPGEFASRGDDRDALVAHIHEAANEIDAALARLTPERLAVRLTPARDLWGEGTPHEISVRRAVLQVIEHASLHAGQLDGLRESLQ
jgi:hypothetical protein